MASVEDKVDNLVEITTKLVVMQEQTTKNIDTLTQDIKETMCHTKECDSLKKRMSKVEGKVELIEGIPNALMMRAMMVAVAGSVMYLLYTVGISK